MKIIVNGRFFSQKVTGVQRYARELMKELDRLVAPNEVEIVVPKNAKDVPHYDNILVKRIGALTGQIWEQLMLPLYAWRNRGITVNLCNTSPLLAPGIVCMHDVKVKVTPQFFSKKFCLWNRLLFANSSNRARAIITTSWFSKGELCRYYHILPNKITVIPVAWQHYNAVDWDEDVFNKYSLIKRNYFFSLSSLEPNKNFKWVADVARNNPTQSFVVAGSISRDVFAEGMGFECPQNMKLIGFINDSEAKTLMRDCKAFLFPSIYEGFGVPVLEAMSVGASVIISETSCMRSIYGEAAHYIDPYNPEVDLYQVLAESVKKPDYILQKFSWEKSAKKLYELIRVISNQKM